MNDTMYCTEVDSNFSAIFALSLKEEPKMLWVQESIDGTETEKQLIFKMDCN